MGFGARGGNRTRKEQPPGDFKSPVFTGFTTRAGRLVPRARFELARLKGTGT